MIHFLSASMKFGQSPLLIATVLNNEDVIRGFQSQGVNSKILKKVSFFMFESTLMLKDVEKFFKA